MKEYLGVIVVVAVAVVWVAMRIVGRLASKQPPTAQPISSSNQLGSDLDTSRVHRPLSSPVDWLMLIIGFGMVGFGIFARPGNLNNPFYQQIWWLLVVLGIGAVIWSISPRRT